MKLFENKWFDLVLCGIVLIICYKVIDNYRDIFSVVGRCVGVLTPFIAGVVMAFFFSKPVGKIQAWLEKNKNSFIKRSAKAIGILCVYLALAAFVGFMIMFIAPRLYKNIREFAANLPKYYGVLTDFINKNEVLSKYIEADGFKNKLLQMINLENVNKWVSVVSGVANSFVSVFLAVVFSIYLIIEKEDIFGFFRVVKARLFKGKSVEIAVMYGRKIIDIFYSYISGMLLDAILIGAITAAALSLFKVPYAVLLGLLVAVGNMIPFFGAIISTVIVFIISAITLGPINALWILLFQLVLGQIDGNLIQPRILSSSTGISPLLVLLSVLVFGNLFGVVGMIAGVPVCAVIKIIILDFLDNGRIDASRE